MKVPDNAGGFEFQWWPDDNRQANARRFRTREEALQWLSHVRSADMVRGIRSLLAGRALAQLSRMTDQELLEETARLLYSDRLTVVDGGLAGGSGEPAVDPHAQFEDWSIDHLKKYFPTQASAMSSSQLRDFVQYGVRRAATYGIKARRDVSKYLDMMVVFGRSFDTDSRHSWAGETLRRRGNSTVTMQTMLEKAKSVLGGK
jgi:hypothetical protein